MQSATIIRGIFARLYPASFMIRDPLYQQIEQQLSKRLDPEVFQRCAGELLSAVYPTLAQNLGGNDAGMDGTIGTLTGSSQLIVTTDRDVIGNVRNSIQQRLKRRKGPRTAVVATSQALSPLRKRNIEKAAEKLGVRLLNIHDGTDFVGRLYQNARWRKELLGLSGNPPALSVFAPRMRDSVPDELFGRAADLAWLRNTTGDVVISGQPGIGKTCLHEQLARQGECLFALDGRDDTELANAIREQSPQIVVVDDAHIRTGLVERLVSLRQVTGADFSIHANSWPNDARAVAQILRCPDANLRSLNLLSRDEVLELVKQRGLFGPDELLHFIIRDADGKPGLVAALVDTCKRKEVHKVWTGEALVDRLLLTHRGLNDERDRAILAMFALGGDSGVRMSAVAETLSIAESELRARVTNLAAGGVIQESGSALQVRPPGLRAALVKQVFFSGPTSLAFPDKLIAGLFPGPVAHVVLRARQIGGAVDLSRVRQAVEAAGDRDTWEHFSFVDESCARMILDDYPQQIALAAPGVLRHFPDEGLRLLFAFDASSATTEGSVENPRRRVAEWIVGERPHDPETPARREQLLVALEAWMLVAENCNTNTAAWAVASLLDLRFEFNRQVPGSGNSWTFMHGLVSQECLRHMVSIWPRVLRLIQLLPINRRKLIRDRIEDWCFPGRHARSPISKVTRGLLRKQARRLLVDLVAIDSSNPALCHWASQMSRWAKINLKIITDRSFDLLYGDHDHSSNWEKDWNNRVELIESYAETLAKDSIDSTVATLIGFEKSADEFERFRGTGPRSVLYRALANRISDPIKWLKKWITARGSSLGTEAFLVSVVNSSPEQAIPLLEQMVSDDKYAVTASLVAIQLETVPKTLLTSARTRLESCCRQDGFVVQLRQLRIPSPNMAFLLTSSEKPLALCAAIAEWKSQPEGEVRSDLTELWEEAVCAPCESKHYELSELLASNPHLCFKWIEGRIAAGIHKSRYGYSEEWQAAINSISRNQRRQLLQVFDRKNFDSELFDALIADDLELLQEWMSGCTDPYLRLHPLSLFEAINDGWVERAICALNAGATPAEIAECSSPVFYGANDESIESHYGKQIEFYKRLKAHSDSRLHKAGKEGFDEATRRMNEELARQRQRQVYGRA